MHVLSVIQLLLPSLQSVSCVRASLQQSVMFYTSMIQTSCLPEWVNISFTNKWTDACIHTLSQTHPEIPSADASKALHSTWQLFLIISLSNNPQVSWAYLQIPHGETILRIGGEREIFQAISSNIDQQLHEGPDVPQSGLKLPSKPTLRTRTCARGEERTNIRVKWSSNPLWYDL